jgi:hypothetical protein
VANPRKPIRGTFVGCCAEVTAPPRANVTTTARIPTNFRFLILDFRLSDKESNKRIQGRSIMPFSVNRKSAIENPKFT